jgi:hypothetical protein
VGQYWKNYVWEYLMCVLAAATLLLNTAQGFYIPDALADQIPMAVALCAALMLLFFLGGYNKVGLVLTPVLTAAVIVLCFFLLRARGVDIVDQEGSDSAAYIYWFAFAIICLTVYLCSRSRIGVAVLFLIGCCVSAGLQFMEYQVFAWAGLLFAISCMVLFLLRQYRAQAMTSSTAAPDFFRFFRSTLALVAAGGILSAGIFFAVIRPLDPPTVDLQFLERYLAFQILEHTGISDSYSLPDQEQFTDRQDDTLDETDQTTQGETPLDQSADTPYETPEPQPDAWERPAGQERLSAVSYTLTPVWRVVLWCVLIALILILPPALRLVWRRHRMKQIQALEPGAQIQALYHFYLSKFRHLGWKKRPGETPLEFAARSGDGLGRYLAGTCGLDELTRAFMETRYGGGVPAPQTCARCREIYAQLLKNCKAQLGRARYLPKFYVL